MTIPFDESKVEPHLFHNELVRVFPTHVKFEDITYWPENNRTLLAFEAFQKAQEEELTPEDRLKKLTFYLASRRDMELPVLAESIRQSGVHLPLILVTDGRLLDGNRRYFACAYLKYKNAGADARPSALDRIPALVIRAADLTDRLRLKILAEANFLQDLKVPWSLDVKARLIYEFHTSLKADGVADEQIYDEILDVFAADKATVDAYLEALAIVRDFIEKAVEDVKFACREIAQEKFVYFWEFRNKATKGRGRLMGPELEEAKPLFFKMMLNERFKNLKQIESFVQAAHDEDLWRELQTSDGSRLPYVIAVLQSEKAIRSQEEKTRQFARWLRATSDTEMTVPALEWLREIVKEAKDILEKQWPGQT
jgi:hypothetical protein